MLQLSSLLSHLILEKISAFHSLNSLNIVSFTTEARPPEIVGKSAQLHCLLKQLEY